MQRLLLAALLLLTTISAGFAQNQRSCGAMEYLYLQQQQDPGLQGRMQQIEDFTQEYVQRAGHQRNNGVVTIPVVVHVVYRTSAENISDAQVLSQIQVLNEDFRRTNGDATNFWPQAADVNIEFCMATVDPNGNPTNGITRTSTKKRSFSYTNDGVKFAGAGGKDAWPADQYLNIWVCNLGSGLLGYAQFPGGNAATDGVVCGYQYFGTIGTATPPFNLGRTATHEVGHWLNLRHIWGDGACGADDFVNDTPESDAPNYGCATGHVSCGTRDMVENYMDYSDDGCMNLFTAGQGTRMNALFAPGGLRASLLTSPGCGNVAAVCNTPSNLSTSNISNTGARFSWSTVTGATSYDLRYRETGATKWTDVVGLTTTSYTASGLTECTDYEWQVLANCAEGGSSAYANAVSFLTTGCVAGTCESPTNVQANSPNNTVTISWNAVTGAISYEVGIRQAGRGNFQTFTTTNTSISISGLRRNRTYEYYVLANCLGGQSAPVGGTFVAGSGNRGGETDAIIFMQPNPASNVLTLSWNDMGDTPINFTVVDVTGRVVFQESNVDAWLGGWDIQVSGWAEGMYLLHVYDEDGVITTERFVVNH